MDAPVTLYTTRYCPFCIRARQLLDLKRVAYRDIPVDGDPKARQEMMAASGRHTVPQIWIGEQHVGGYDDLAALERAGELDTLLTSAGALSEV
ncbi:MAG: glutaredoxin 3 [Pseudomonadota bacterium]